MREADGETGRLLSICVFWPEDAEACFYLQAPEWRTPPLDRDRAGGAGERRERALDVLGIAELKQRCVASGLVQEDDRSNDRARLQQMLADFVAQRKSSRRRRSPCWAARAHRHDDRRGEDEQAMDAGKQPWATGCAGCAAR